MGGFCKKCSLMGQINIDVRNLCLVHPLYTIFCNDGLIWQFKIIVKSSGICKCLICDSEPFARAALLLLPDAFRLPLSHSEYVFN